MYQHNIQLKIHKPVIRVSGCYISVYDVCLKFFLASILDANIILAQTVLEIKRYLFKSSVSNLYKDYKLTKYQHSIGTFWFYIKHVQKGSILSIYLDKFK
jgi:hypothetical protein